MHSTTFTVRVDTAKNGLERLAKSTGRSRSFLAAEAINEYLDINEWQVAGIKQATPLSIAAKRFPTSGSKFGSHPGAMIASGRSPNVHEAGLVA